MLLVHRIGYTANIVSLEGLFCCTRSVIEAAVEEVRSDKLLKCESKSKTYKRGIFDITVHEGVGNFTNGFFFRFYSI